MYSISPYIPEQHNAAALSLWQDVFATSWPMTPALFENVLHAWLPEQRSDHFVATLDSPVDGIERGKIVGLVVTQVNRKPNAPPDGCLQAVAVDPRMQRRGVGKALHDRALAYFRAYGVQTVQLGGNYPRFWPGVPSGLPQVEAFFKALGWVFSDHVDYDLTRRLDGYVVPAEIREQMAAERITIERARADQTSEIIAFEEREFPGWADIYRAIAAWGDFQDTLVARDPRKGIVGTLNMFTPQSHPQRVDALWKTLLGERLGGLGEVGVAASERGRGIGLALVAYGTEILCERGADTSFIGYTGLVDFYGKVGYKVWKRFEMSKREI